MSAFRNCYFHKCSLRKSYISIFVINFSIPVFWVRDRKKDCTIFFRADFRCKLIAQTTQLSVDEVVHLQKEESMHS